MMPSILPPKKTVMLVFGFAMLIVTTLACGNAKSPATDKVVILTRLPTLTPTVANGGGNPVNAAAPVEATAITDPAAATPIPAESMPVVADTATPAQPVDPGAAPVDSAAPDATVPGAMASSGSSSSPSLIITALNKVEEYVDIQNISQQDQDLRGWNVYSEKDGQKCNLAGTLTPGQTLRVWALAASSAQGGYNCGFSQEIWSDTEADAAILYDPFGVETSRSQ